MRQRPAASISVRVKVLVLPPPEFWSCEFRIPLSSLDIPAGAGARWAVNIARGARGLAPAGKTMEHSAIAADGAYHIGGSDIESDASGVAQEHRFAPQSAEALRSYITETLGANAKITEIEVYEK